MKKQVDEEEEIFVYETKFENLAECDKYYLDILSILKQSLDAGIITKKEFKAKKKARMRQWKSNQGTLNKRDNYNREQEEKLYKNNKPKEKPKGEKPKLPAKKEVKAVEGNVEQKQLEYKEQSDEKNCSSEN